MASRKIVIGCVCCFLYLDAQQEISPVVFDDQDTEIGTAFDQTNPDHLYKNDEEERRIQLLAVQTVANMAQGIINIGHAPDDSSVVAREVANIMGSFANFVVQAMKNPAIIKLMQDEEFCTSVCRSVVERRKPHDVAQKK